MQTNSIFYNQSFEDLSNDLSFYFDRLNIRISLAAVFMEGPKTSIYRNLLQSVCKPLPLSFSEYVLPHNTEINEIIEFICSLDQKDDITAIFIDLPFNIKAQLFQKYILDPQTIIQIKNSINFKECEKHLFPNESEVIVIHNMLEKLLYDNWAKFNYKTLT